VSDSEKLLRSPLHLAHLDAGGRMVGFAGWEMPVQFAGIMPEHHAVRQDVGVFDISHMGQLFLEGGGAGVWLDGMLTNDLSVLGDGEGQYTLMLNEQGGVIDDLIVYRIAEDRYFLVVNASMREEDVAWLGGHLADGLSLNDASEHFAAVAIQGPKSARVYAALAETHGLPPLPERNGIAFSDEEKTVVCRTGYTGEDGYELFLPVDGALDTYAAILAAVADAGGQPCGLGARDSLRLEMGYPLNGSDLSPDLTPLQAGLSFFCKLDKADFLGREVLLQQKQDRLPSRLVAIEVIGKSPPPRPHYPVLANGEQIGELCSAVLSPTLGKGIGMAYLPEGFTRRGTQLEIEVRGRRFAAEVVRKPFAKA